MTLPLVNLKLDDFHYSDEDFSVFFCSLIADVLSAATKFLQKKIRLRKHED